MTVLTWVKIAFKILLLIIVLPWYLLVGFIKWRLYRGRMLSQLEMAGMSSGDARTLVGGMSPINFIKNMKAVSTSV